jgi:hypothetical protein
MFKDRGLVGAHPGVNFKELGSADVSAEADLLLLFADATLVPGEVKRTGAGITPDTVDKLQTTTDRLGAPWSFFAIGQAARECQSNVPAAAIRDDDRPRLVVTTDQIFHMEPFWALGNDPFAWKPLSQSEEDERSGELVRYLRDRAPDDPWSSQGSQLLRDWE